MKRILIIYFFIIVLLTGCVETDGKIQTSGSTGSSSQTQELSSNPSGFPISSSPEQTDYSLFSNVDNTTDCDKIIKERKSIKDIFTFPGFGIYFSARAHSGYLETIDTVNQQIPIECLRQKENGDYYAVFHPKEGGRVYSFFTKQDKYYLSHSLYILEPLNKSDFELLKNGDQFSRVLSIDPAIQACYMYNALCNLFSISDDTLCTVHHFKDEIWMISYQKTGSGDTEEDWRIEKIERFSDHVIVVNKPGYLIDGSYDYSILTQDYVNS